MTRMTTRMRRKTSNNHCYLSRRLCYMLAIVPSILFLFLASSLIPSLKINQDVPSTGSFAHASQQHHHHATSTTTTTKTKSQFNTLSSDSNTQRKIFELVQVQIIHRHGDRSPITPMKDEKYWSNTLPSPTLLSKIATGTKIKRREGDSSAGTNHAAGGRGPFGKLTQLGLLQMVDVGSRLRDELYLEEKDKGDDEEGNHFDENGNMFLHKGKLFHKDNPLSPEMLTVKSTDFPRTIQSVQAVLIGMFPEGYTNDQDIEIDARYTNLLIPDPQPRTTKEQMELEKSLSQREYVLAKEAKLQRLAEKVSLELRPFVGEDAHSVSFGIGEEGDLGVAERPLSFSQLSEILVCFKVRGLLPESITIEEYETVTSHSAWKWFENLRNNRLAFLAMKSFMNFIMENLQDGQKRVSTDSNADYRKLHIFSAHDSSLIGLMCAFRLQQPSEWPEYGSYLKIELFKARPFASTQHTSNNGVGDEYFVRFSLNGHILKSEWGLGEDDYMEARDMMPLDHLQATIISEHGY